MDWNNVLRLAQSADFIVVADILAVAFLIYRLLLLAKGTRAWQIIAGLVTFFAAVVVSDFLGLGSLNWLLRQAFPLGPVALTILFLPELRHALEEFGRPGFWGRSFGLMPRETMAEVVDEVVRAVSTMSVKRIGALIVFERENALQDVIDTGTVLNAQVTSELIGTIFYKGSPLHDGAAIVRQDQIVAAGCTLPLTVSPKVDATVHTRHKAALGISEESDAAVVIVSEETGTVSLAVGGKLWRGYRDDTLRDRMMELLQLEDSRSATARRIGEMASKVGGALRTGRAREPESAQAERRSR
jgi:diadenylate cyclase